MIQHTKALSCDSASLRASGRNAWSLTPQSFEKLLDHLDTDPERAATKYVKLHRELTNFFAAHRCIGPDIHADETINRVARRIDQGAVITNLPGFIYGVARLVVKEAHRENHKMGHSLDDLIGAELAQPGAPEKSYYLECLQECLQQLPDNGRELLLEYYEGTASKLRHRRELARRCGLSANALRIRTHRLKLMVKQNIGHRLGGRTCTRTASGNPRGSRLLVSETRNMNARPTKRRCNEYNSNLAA